MSDRLSAIEFRKILNELKETKEMQVEAAVVMAEITRAKYLALRLQGFNEEQAIALCK